MQGNSRYVVYPGGQNFALFSGNMRPDRDGILNPMRNGSYSPIVELPGEGSGRGKRFYGGVTPSYKYQGPGEKLGPGGNGPMRLGGFGKFPMHKFTGSAGDPQPARYGHTEFGPGGPRPYGGIM